MITHQAITLSELNLRVAKILASDHGLNGVWVTAETSDVRAAGGHCYMELIQKNPETGIPVAKSRAVIWASTFSRLSAAFYAATGSRLQSDIKVMVRVSVNFHSVYGFSLIITDIDPDYTIGDLVRRRNEIIARLQAEGVSDLNRSLPWSPTPNRIAIISAAGAAGYGDFLKHLHLNPLRLKFETELFPAAMQGERTSASIIEALENIMAKVDDFDCVVIIRGGGAVSDLAWFDDYNLAFNVAQFPLPVIVGIGHQRDINVLDYIANTSVKTPTAAAEALIGRMAEALAAVVQTGRAIERTASAQIAAQRQQLAYLQGNIPAFAINCIDRQKQRLSTLGVESIVEYTGNILRRQADRLDAAENLLAVLSPQATLKRGFSITTVNGKVLRSTADVAPGDTIITNLQNGKITSKVL